ncbi:MAG: hypothetical protein OES10_10590 [Gammaproteobacteria bacterium]|nr:hypothetical protein [Gammaproteobacteria bacterium]MDH3751183.1 hypothetical protein [Gammaproteobacteria bacterium]
MATLLLAGCATQIGGRHIARIGTVATHEVTVNFDANGCPTSVTAPVLACSVGPAGFCVKRGSTIKWKSDASRTAYEVFFDPFVGRPYASHGPDEEIGPVIIRRDTLAGEYKYGVFGVACRSGNAVLDPPLRVEN